MYWVNGPPDVASGSPLSLSGKIRHRERATECQLTKTGSAWELAFAEPLRGVAPSQVAALYDGDVCLGGGLIARAE